MPMEIEVNVTVGRQAYANGTWSNYTRSETGIGQWKLKLV